MRSSTRLSFCEVVTLSTQRDRARRVPRRCRPRQVSRLLAEITAAAQAAGYEREMMRGYIADLRNVTAAPDAKLLDPAA
jgi:hypothetical protein